PRTAMNDNERQILANYLKNSGQVFFLTNPGAPDDIARLLAPWGVDVKSGTVIDPTNYSAPNRDSPIVNRDGNYFGLTTVYFPGVTAIGPQEKPVEGMELLPILLTSVNSWLTTTDVPASEAKFDETKDTRGPLYIGFIILPASSEDANQTATSGPRIAVIGDSDFASNKHFVNGDNSDLFLNIVSGFAAGSELITIQRKVLQTRRLILSPEKERFLTYSSIAFLPLVILAIGVFVWWRRR
ncbi:MAG: hypothetical protein Q8O43_11060, partial [Dehalococcoidia bacterium]|nr:hypothetical protein [Dehalococcoidia bacterium]